jgi:hypothetical protein
LIPCHPSNNENENLNYLKTQLITVEEYKNEYKPIDDFDPSVSSDLEEIKK